MLGLAGSTHGYKHARGDALGQDALVKVGVDVKVAVERAREVRVGHSLHRGQGARRRTIASSEHRTTQWQSDEAAECESCRAAECEL